ncbi:DMT family transporter [Pseudoruegeria sp. HB172150]|uniref:DMT family transporter n=1 Tax=Pseudoruegeria sp. HB172150 TaxID=2721164 RepID=UPI001554CAF9|nr:DMT family transporter [Pseudoruegeria sp. HB172150]
MPDITPPPSRPLAGVLWMLITGIQFVGVTAVVKYIGPGIPAAEAAFLRYSLGLIFLIPAMRPIFSVRLDRVSKTLFGIRGLVHTLGVILWFFAMTRIPLAEVTAMGYIYPVYVTIGAAIFLGEKLAVRRIAAIGVALIGGLIILRPGFRELSEGHIAMLGNGMLFAVSYLIAKVMTGRVPPVVVVGWLSISVTVFLLPFAIPVWVWPTWEQMGLFLIVAGFATGGHYTMTMAFASAPLAVTQPVTFLQLVWSVSLGALVFSEPVDGWVVFGGVLVLGAVSFIAWREAVLKRRVVTPALEEGRL